MGAKFKECRNCGAHLDAGEVCDCRKEKAGLIVICREVDRDTGRIAVYPLDMEVQDQDLRNLSIRARVNPELRYFITTKAHYKGFEDVITGALKKKTVTAAVIANVGGIVEL